MGRPRKYASEAEKQKAYRERQAGQTDAEPAALEAAEEAYVARELAVTRAYAESFRAKEKREGLEERLKRSEAYARWRFRAFLDGEVGSL